MKKLFSICLIFAATMLMTAQSTLPRWGSGPPTNDNTGRVLTYQYTQVTAGTAAIEYLKNPRSFMNIWAIDSVRHIETDSAAIVNAYVGDELIIRYSCDSAAAGHIITFGNHLKGAGTLTITKNKKATICFIFDGVAWTEKSRTINTD
jgi:hypothetical protein